jgi:hypothetical protein
MGNDISDQSQAEAGPPSANSANGEIGDLKIIAAPNVG